MVNNKIAEKNTLRVPKRSAIQPDAGIKTAIVSEYAITTDCIISGLWLKLFAMLGSAVLTIVESKVSIKKPIATNQRSRLDEAGFAEPEDVVVGIKKPLLCFTPVF
jgi:hypothetical protein